MATSRRVHDPNISNTLPIWTSDVGDLQRIAHHLCSMEDEPTLVDVLREGVSEVVVTRDER